MCSLRLTMCRSASVGHGEFTMQYQICQRDNKQSTCKCNAIRQKFGHKTNMEALLLGYSSFLLLSYTTIERTPSVEINISVVVKNAFLSHVCLLMQWISSI